MIGMRYNIRSTLGTSLADMVKLKFSRRAKGSEKGNQGEILFVSVDDQLFKDCQTSHARLHIVPPSVLYPLCLLPSSSAEYNPIVFLSSLVSSCLCKSWKGYV